MNLSQHSDNIVYDEGLEPVGYHEDVFLQPAGTRALLAGNHGLEAVPSEDPNHNQLPEVSFGREEKEACHTNTSPPEMNSVVLSNSTPPQRSKRHCWGAAAIITMVIIASTIVAIVEGLRHKRSQSTGKANPETAADPASNTTLNLGNSTLNLTTSELSTTGASNGTALSMVAPENISDKIFIYFQHFSGEIRYSELTDGGWSGGGNAQTAVSSNVKNRTQLAGISTKADNVLTTYLFYVDTSGILRDVFQSDSNGSWSIGNINDLNIRISDSPKAALAACWDPVWYGSDIGHSAGLRLYVGEQDSLIHEYMWDQTSNTWYTGYVFPNSNGDGGAKCWTGETTYLYMQNSNHELQMFWNDLNPNASNTTTHPLGVWNQGPIAAGIDIRPNSSLAMSYYAYYQDSKNQIFGIFPNASAESASWGTPFQVGTGTAIPGTAIDCQTFYPSNDSPSGIYVFFQTNASNVVENVRPQYGGAWSNNFVPVG